MSKKENRKLSKKNFLKRIRIETMELINLVIYKKPPIEIYRQKWRVEDMIREYNIRTGGSMTLESTLSPTERNLLESWLEK